MSRSYVMSKPRGKRGPYKKKSKAKAQKWTPRRKLPSSSPRKSPSTPTKKCSAVPSSPRQPILTSFGDGARAVTIAIYKLLLKPKHHTKTVEGRRLNFKVVSYTEIINYMQKHPRACKLLPTFDLEKDLPSKSTVYRLLNRLGFDRSSRTREKDYYKRFFSNVKNFPKLNLKKNNKKF